MRRILLAIAMLVPWFILPTAAQAQQKQQQLVDRATLTVQDMVNNRDGTQAQSVLKQARAVLICPRIFQAGFLLGAQGGNCVLVARDGAGGWSFPAFYGLAGGSIGFQAGLQDAEIMLMIMNDRALSAIMDSQFKIGADASITIIDLGGGVEGATTAALNASIVGFTRARGLFAGISLGGSLLNSRTDWNQAYYGQPLAARQIVISMQASNPAANPLREVLTRYGAPQAAVISAPPPRSYDNRSYQRPYTPPSGAPRSGAPLPLAPPPAAVQQTPLPPPR